MSNVSEAPACMPRLALFGLPLLLFFTAILGVEQTAEAGPGRHPLYEDGNTLRWYADLGEAQRVAAREGKLILVDVSLSRSLACKTAIGLIRDPAIRDRIARVAVGYHVDARRSGQFARIFRRNLRSTAYLPWVGFFSSSVNWVSGFAPSKRTTRSEMRRRFLVALDRAESAQRRLPRRAGVSSSAPVRTPTARRTAPRSEPVSRTPAARKKTGSSASGLRWYESISEAKQAARAQGKIILITSTKPSCGLCKKLIEKIVPQVSTQMSQGCVFYRYDITRPESAAVDRLVRANHRGSRLMPLAGFMTPEMRWLHSFHGGTDAGKLMADYRTAQRAR